MGLGKTVQVIAFFAAVLGKTGTKADVYGKYMKQDKTKLEVNKLYEIGCLRWFGTLATAHRARARHLYGFQRGEIKDFDKSEQAQILSKYDF
jgi:hypothetical protein